jgi:alkylated DNA repair dioxygenase AlkB
MLFPTLFDKKIFDPKNIIPHGGEAIYYGELFEETEADRLYRVLLEDTPWHNAEWITYNKEFITDRKVAWYGRKREWPEELLRMKEKVEAVTKVKYNNVLLNLYDTGDVGVGWHADEESLEEDSSIASVSLGAERRFDFRHRETKEKVSIVLEHGSLLVMQGVLQNYWLHQLAKCKHVRHPRINLTFRR